MKQSTSIHCTYTIYSRVDRIGKAGSHIDNDHGIVFLQVDKNLALICIEGQVFWLQDSIWCVGSNCIGKVDINVIRGIPVNHGIQRQGHVHTHVKEFLFRPLVETDQSGHRREGFIIKGSIEDGDTSHGVDQEVFVVSLTLIGCGHSHAVLADKNVVWTHSDDTDGLNQGGRSQGSIGHALGRVKDVECTWIGIILGGDEEEVAADLDVRERSSIWERDAKGGLCDIRVVAKVRDGDEANLGSSVKDHLRGIVEGSFQGSKPITETAIDNTYMYNRYTRRILEEKYY